MYQWLVLVDLHPLSTARVRISRVDLLYFAAGASRRDELFHPQGAPSHGHELSGGYVAELIHWPSPPAGGNARTRETPVPGFGESASLSSQRVVRIRWACRGGQLLERSYKLVVTNAVDEASDGLKGFPWVRHGGVRRYEHADLRLP